ncbi:ABC transporter ATP-binding protein [Geminicoccaceae bacterium 1502E]|nr:ABC transporter ATP-binding protein [Geminicoccaceae bacterium 1502E]
MTLRLEQLARRVGKETHLYRMDLTLEPGLNVLLGPTLAGKTSLMRLMAGLDRPSEGRVLVDGRDVTGRSVRERSVAMVYQQFINYPSLTVYDNIASPLRLARLPRPEIDRKVREVAGLLHIEHLLERLPAELSGGQQQRTAIGRALVKEADLLLLDEPLVNLDYKLREELRAELQAIFAQRRAVVVYATTEPLEALVLGGRTVVMGEGRILQTGPTLQVYHHPASTDVARIFSDPPMNMLDGMIADGRVSLGEGIVFPPSAHLAALPAGRYRFGVRANHLGIARRRPGDVEFPAEVALAEVSGSETFVHLLHDGVDLVVQEEGIHSLRLGATMSVFLAPQQLYVFDAAGALAAAPARREG